MFDLIDNMGRRVSSTETLKEAKVCGTQMARMGIQRLAIGFWEFNSGRWELRRSAGSAAPGELIYYISKFS